MLAVQVIQIYKILNPYIYSPLPNPCIKYVIFPIYLPFCSQNYHSQTNVTMLVLKTCDAYSQTHTHCTALNSCPCREGENYFCFQPDFYSFLKFHYRKQTLSLPTEQGFSCFQAFYIWFFLRGMFLCHSICRGITGTFPTLLWAIWIKLYVKKIFSERPSAFTLFPNMAHIVITK